MKSAWKIWKLRSVFSSAGSLMHCGQLGSRRSGHDLIDVELEDSLLVRIAKSGGADPGGSQRDRA